MFFFLLMLSREKTTISRDIIFSYIIPSINYRLFNVIKINLKITNIFLT